MQLLDINTEDDSKFCTFCSTQKVTDELNGISKRQGKTVTVERLYIGDLTTLRCSQPWPPCPSVSRWPQWPSSRTLCSRKTCASSCPSPRSRTSWTSTCSVPTRTAKSGKKIIVFFLRQNGNSHSTFVQCLIKLSFSTPDISASTYLYVYSMYKLRMSPIYSWVVSHLFSVPTENVM